MFGRGKRQREELLELKMRLDEMQNDLSALKSDVQALRELKDERNKDPDVMSEGEMLNKWYMGEKGDGF